jgi:hypothetical protein
MPELIQLTRTVFMKSVKDAPVTPTKSTKLYVLKAAASNNKLTKGKSIFTKGRFVGMPLYTLTLEERATCPTTCDRWNDCYGNRMVYATRYNVNPELFRALRADTARLSTLHPQGFVVRLHVLGDFSSVLYVEHWRRLLDRHPELHIFGYTHTPHGTSVGDAVAALTLDFKGRVSILRSNGLGGDDPLPAARVASKDATAALPGTAVVCPEQTGKAASCLECGLCTLGKIGVTFINHGREVKRLAA